MNTVEIKDDWRLVKRISNGKHKAKCIVWKVEKITENGKQVGYFKVASKEKEKYIGPMIANELIGYKLAQLLHLPVAHTELAKINGELGVVSVEWPVYPLFKWKYLKPEVHQNITRFIHQADLLLQMFVFDMWIINIDRHNRNVIVYPKNNKYHFYLIDHGLSLAGAVCFRKRKWTSPYWNNVNQFNYRYIDGLLNYIQNYDQLEPFVKKVEDITLEEIEDVVFSISNDIVSKDTRENMILFLQKRQKKLRRMIKKWLSDKGKEVSS